MSQRSQVTLASSVLSIAIFLITLALSIFPSTTTPLCYHITNSICLWTFYTNVAPLYYHTHLCALPDVFSCHSLYLYTQSLTHSQICKIINVNVLNMVKPRVIRSFYTHLFKHFVACTHTHI